MKGLYFLLFVLTVAQSFAQKEANVWITGDDYGLDFNYGRFRVFDREAFGSNVAATSVSICDKATGELLFYSDGANVWDKNFNIMPNGEGIISGVLFGQHALIVPMPGAPSRYYLFTVKRIEGEVGNGLYYTVIDMSLNSGLGDVISETKNTLLFANPLEALSGTIHDNGRDFWLLTHEDSSDRFVVFPITPQGIEQPDFFEFGPIYNGYKYGGMVQISPDRTMMAFNISVSRNVVGQVNEASPLELYDFDANTGEISNRRVLGDFPSIMSLIFSPDNSKLYMGSYNHREPALLGLLWQFDLSAGTLDEIIQSQATIKWGFRPPGIPDPVPLPSFKLQLGPDGRLYNGATGIQPNGNGVSQRMLFYLDRPNASLNNAEPKFRYLDSPNNSNLRTNDNLFEQSFPNFMQYYFNGLEPIDNSLTPAECAGIILTVHPNPSDGYFFIKGSIENCLFPAYIKITIWQDSYCRKWGQLPNLFPRLT